MTELSYSFRPRFFSSEKVYALRPDGLEWKSRRDEGRVAYGDIAAIHTGQVRYLGSSIGYWRCVLSTRSGGRIGLSAAHHAGFRRIEDRSAAYFPFTAELQRRIAAANPQVVAATKRDWLDGIETIVGSLGVALLGMARRADYDRIAGTVGWIARKIGPRLRGHRMARTQLAAVFPDKSAAEIERILAAMWDNLGRVFVEYAHLERLCAFDPQHPEAGRIVMDAATVERCRRACESGKPALVFGAHVANWEASAFFARPFGRQFAVVFRSPRMRPIADELSRVRANCGYALIPAGPDIAFRIKDAMKRNLLIGMLIDQHYAHGLDVTFFGRVCKANPLFARFARMFDCAIYGARIIRLPQGRFRFELTDPIEPPRDAQGKVDVDATTQLVTSVIEGWVREYPEQWMWLHRRWR